MKYTLSEAIKIVKKYKTEVEFDMLMSSEVSEAIDRVVSAVENPTYTPADMEAFAEWCYINAEWSKKNEWMLFANDGSGFKVTTTQVRERWEVETGRKEATE